MDERIFRPLRSPYLYTGKNTNAEPRHNTIKFPEVEKATIEAVSKLSVLREHLELKADKAALENNTERAAPGGLS